MRGRAIAAPLPAVRASLASLRTHVTVAKARSTTQSGRRNPVRLAAIPEGPKAVLTMRSLALMVAAAAFARAGFAEESQLASTYFDDAKLTVNARAQADGFMRVRVIPQNGAPREATVAIA